jgi:hypothetical protein
VDKVATVAVIIGLLLQLIDYLRMRGLFDSIVAVALFLRSHRFVDQEARWALEHPIGMHPCEHCRNALKPKINCVLWQTQ